MEIRRGGYQPPEASFSSISSSVARLRRPSTLEMGREKQTPRASVSGPAFWFTARMISAFSLLWATM